MAEPITRDEAKAQCRVDASFTLEDALIDSYIVAAREFVEGETGLVLTPRSVTETVPVLGRWIDLRAWPVTSITGISYLDGLGVSQALLTGSWRVMLGARPVRLWPVTFGWGVPWGRTPMPATVTMQAGYPTTGDVPEQVKQAMRLLVSHFYANRSAVETGVRAVSVEVQFAVDRLLRRYKLKRL